MRSGSTSLPTNIRTSRCRPGKTPQAHLEDLTWSGAAWRYPDGVPEKVRDTLRKELALIAELDYAPYFLTVHDIVPSRGAGHPLPGPRLGRQFRRLLLPRHHRVDPAETTSCSSASSRGAREPPDIDVDFEHERREEVIQYIYARYGRDRAGHRRDRHLLPAAQRRPRGRQGARPVRGCHRAALAGTVWGSWGRRPRGRRTHIRQAGLDPANPLIAGPCS
jgi:error-prone DNA polymerase